MIKFIPSYVGSKSYWVKKLNNFKDDNFIEVFSGSAVLSANLAKTTILNDIDSYIFKIFSNYNELIVPEVFTELDYFKVRSQEDWWKYIYCLQKMSFSGVFRYSKNGYNVPIKKTIKEIHIMDEFILSKNRFNELSPTILNVDFKNLNLSLFDNKIVILDPPYEGCQAAYNKKFDYIEYWNFVEKIRNISKAILLFDTKNNLINKGYKIDDVRQMRVNGSKMGNIEALSILYPNII